jgi:hypothetical protein
MFNMSDAAAPNAISGAFDYFNFILGLCAVAFGGLNVIYCMQCKAPGNKKPTGQIRV